MELKDIELLQFIHKTAQMGISGLQTVEGRIHSRNMLQAVKGQISEYQSIAKDATNLLQKKGEQPVNPSKFALLSSELMSAVKTITDPSASKIAEMVIQGNNMGITKGIKHLHDYAGNDCQVRALAERLVQTEQNNVEQMKPFL
jgi:hypothetical protein